MGFTQDSGGSSEEARLLLLWPVHAVELQDKPGETTVVVEKMASPIEQSDSRLLVQALMELKSQTKRINMTLNSIDGGIKGIAFRANENGKVITCFTKAMGKGSRYSSRRSSRSSHMFNKGIR